MRVIKINRDLIYCLILSIASMLVISWTTSPLYNIIGNGDSSIFLVIGKSMVNGMKLYTDIFDHKGPILFFINALPQIALNSPIGVWFIQVLFMCLSLYFILGIATYIDNKKFKYMFPIIYLIPSFITFEGGNLSEEYSNLFVLIAMYYFIKGTKVEKDKLNTKISCILGICFTIIAFIRVNNAAMIVSIFLFMFIYYLINKRYKELFQAMIYFILGSLIILIPIIIYFSLHSNFMDCIYATFLFNFNYQGSNQGLIKNIFKIFSYTPFHSLLIIGIFTLMLILTIKLYQKNRLLLYFLFLSLFICIVAIAISGRGYYHYLTIFTPFIILLLMILFSEFNFIIFKKIIIIISISIVFMLEGYYIMRIPEMKLDWNKYIIESKELATSINSKDSIFGYNMTADWFYINDILPVYKYFTLQDWWSYSDEEIINGIYEMLSLNSPEYIVTPSIDKINSSSIKELILLKYDLFFENNIGQVYELK